MGNTRNTGYLQNIVQYDASNNITLPANLTVTGTITGYATTSYVGTQLGGYVPSTRTISINGTSLDLSANRSFTINSMVYPGAGIAVSTGTAWGTSLTDNSTNWNTAYSWGNHAIAGYLTGITSGQVTTALGFTPYNATNPSGYITTAALSTYATQSYVGTQIANLVASSPAALDTLNELAAALGNDAAFSTTVSTALGNRLRVDINTQGLSATQQGYGRTNLGLGTAATANTGDFVAYRTFGTAANNNTGDFAAASHTHSIANVTGLQTALDGKQASLGYTPYNSTNPSGYISSYTETDTLASVTGRGATTSTALTLSGGATVTGLTIAKSAGISTITFPAGTNDPAFISHTESTANVGIMRFSVGDDNDTIDYFAFGNTNVPDAFRINANGIISIGTWQGTAITDSYISSAATWNAKQAALNGTGFVKITGTTISYDNTSYLPLTGGTLSGTLSLNSYSFSGDFGAGKSIYFAVGYTSTRGINFGWDTTNDRGFIGSVYNGQAWKSLDLQPIGGSVLINGNTAWHSGNLTNNNQLTNGAGYITSYTETSTLANVTARGSSTANAISINRNTAGLLFNRDAVTNYNGIYYQTAGVSKWFVGMRENLSSNNYIIYSEQISQDILTLNVANGNTTIYGNLAVGNSTEVLGLIQMGSGGRYGMGVSGAYTNIYSHDSGLGVRLGSYNGTAFTPVLTVANTGTVTATGNISAANLSGTNTGDQTTISGNAGSATLLKSINTTSSILSNWNPQALTYQAWGQAWAHSSISADTGDMVLWLRAAQYSAGGTEVCMIIDGDYYAGSGAQKVLHAGNYSSYSVPLSGGTMTGGLQINTPSNGVGSAFQLYSTAYHQYLSIYSNGAYESMVNYRNTTTQWYSGLRTSTQLVGTDGFHFYNTTQAQTVAGFSNNGTIYSIGNVNVNGEGNFGPDSGSDNGIRIRYGNYASGYGRIRFMQDGTNHSTIHSFSATWQSGTAYTASSGCINIDGQNGVTFGGWNTINAAITSEGLAIKPYTTPSGAKAWNSAGRIRVQQSDGTDVFIEMRNRADSGDYAGILFTDNNIGGYIGFRTYAANNLAAGSDCMIYGTYNDHIFQNGSSESFNGKTETFRIYANGSVRATGDITAYSDKRVKENIITIDKALEKTLQLRGVFYNRTDKDDKSQKVGVIAQEIQEILPQVVNEDYNGLLSVSYGNITGLLIEAVKEQQTQIESQKSEIDELKDLVKQLINRQ